MIPGPDGIDPAAVDSLDAAASHLYGLAADDFVVARDHLARGLRAAGRKDLAAAVKTLRRPTAVAAELNRALRADPAARNALLTAAEALRAGHHRLLSGGHADLTQLQGAHRAAAADLAGHAGSHRESVAAALEAASLDANLHDQLQAATFAQEPQPARGFDLLGAGLATAVTVERDQARPARSTPARSTPARSTPARSTPARSTPARSRRTVSDGPVDGGPDANHGPSGTERSSSRHPDDARPGPAPDTGGADDPAAAGPTAADLARAEQEAAARKTAITERANAERRLEAARAGELRAAAKVAELEQRLAEARAHLHDTETRTAAAASALERADLRLRQLSTHPPQR